MPSTPPLDPSQQAVLDLPDGASAVVLGAPGSGKTAVAVALIADRVRSGRLAPEQVLLLAPRRTQAGRLRDALLLACDRPVTTPLARTPASLAFDIARRRAAAAGEPDPALVTGAEQDARIVALTPDSPVEWPAHLDDAVRGMRAFRDELREVWARCVERDVDEAGLAALGRRYGRPEWVAAARFWAEYRENLEWAGGADAFDSSELVALATAATQRGEAGEVAGRLRLIVVDDLQDMGEAAVGLLAALAARGCAVIAFGDPDIAADTFRGGEPDLPGRFPARLGVPGVRRLQLSTVHRHPAVLRTFVSQVTSRIGTARAGTHRAVAVATPDGEPVRRIEGAGGGELAERIAHVLRDRVLRSGVAYAEQAVVVRSGALVEPLARALEVAGVPTTTSAAGSVNTADRAPRALLDVVALALGLRPLTPESATEVLTGPLGGLDGLALRRLRLALRVEELGGGGTRSAGELLVDALGQPDRLTTVDGPAARRAARLARTLADVRALDAAGASAEEVLWRVWDDSGLAAPWRDRALGAGLGAAEANRDLDGVVALFAAAARAAERTPDDPASQFVSAQLDADVVDDTLAPTGRRAGVLVTTPARVAGLEFDTVVIAGLQDGVWPNLRPRGSLLGATDLIAALDGRAEEATPVDERKALLSDELRLFALAASRATSRLYLAAVANDDEAPSVLHGLGAAPPDTPAAAFAPNSLRPLVGRLRRIAAETSGPTRDDAAAALARLAAAEVPGADPASWWGLAAPTTEQPLEPDPAAPVRVSPSSVETFEDSPLDWFADRVAGSAPMLSGAIGTLLHWVMETARSPDEAALLAVLEGRWGELDFDAEWEGARERRIAGGMVAAVARYLADRQAEGWTLLGGETEFLLEAGRAHAKGKIDRVERAPDGRVRVVDLKTGSKSGWVSEKSAPEHAQLGIYQLAVLSGAVAQVPAGAVPGGAALLYVKQGTAKSPYTLRAQAPLDDVAVQAFRDRLASAADGMAGARFRGTVEVPERHGRDDYLQWLLRVPEVCGG